MDCRGGILILSSIGTSADRNLCAHNRSDGILAQRDPEDPEKPCDCRFTANRCHDNQQAGIGFFSSQGLARDNECWGNALTGILLQRDPEAPKVPTNTGVIGNRCRDNHGPGIAFLSSQGLARDNDCWGNALAGIHLRRGQKTPDAPADAELIGNRCHNNQQDGIIFLSSNGPAEGNHCWSNGLSDIISQQRQWCDKERHYLGQLPECAIQRGSHFTTPPEPAARRNRHLVEALTALGIDRPEPLADFLRSGCLDCFGRFWSGDSAARTADPEPAEPTVQETGPIDPNAPRVYFYSQDPRGRVKLERKRHYGKSKARLLADTPDALAKPPQPRYRRPWPVSSKHGLRPSLITNGIRSTRRHIPLTTAPRRLHRRTEQTRSRKGPSRKGTPAWPGTWPWFRPPRKAWMTGCMAWKMTGSGVCGPSRGAGRTPMTPRTIGPRA